MDIYDFRLSIGQNLIPIVNLKSTIVHSHILKIEA